MKGLGLIISIILVIGGLGNIYLAKYQMDYVYGFGFLTVGIAIYFILKPKSLTKEEMEFLKKAEAEEKEKNK